MKAQVIEDYCATPQFKSTEIDKPHELDVNQVLVKMKVTSLNRGDTIIRRGGAKMIYKLKMPCVLGMEGSGTVEQVGSNVTKFKPGDDVILLYQNARSGACAEYAVCEEDELVTKPGEMSFEQAAVLPTIGVTALEMFRKHPSICKILDDEIAYVMENGKLSDAPTERPDLKMLVIGASGGCGMACILLAKGFLSRYFNVKVYGVCSERNTNIVASLGTDVVIDYTKTTAAAGKDTIHPYESQNVPSICELVRQHGDNTVELVLECVGGHYFYDDVCRNLCSEQGANQVIFAAIAPPGICEVTVKTLFQLGAYIISNKIKSYFSGYPSYYFTEMKANNKDQYFVTHFAFKEHNSYEKIPLISFPLEEINNAHALIESERAVGKVILNIDE